MLANRLSKDVSLFFIPPLSKISLFGRKRIKLLVSIDEPCQVFVQGEKVKLKTSD